MGWLRYLLLDDFGQQLDIEDQRRELEKLRFDLSAVQAQASQREHLWALQRENDELKLFLAAVLRLLVAKKVTTAEEIRELVTSIDREDGRADGRYSGPLAPPFERDWQQGAPPVRD